MSDCIADDVKIETITDCKKIRGLLTAFDPIFPHLKEKILSYDEYAQKLSRYANVVICKINNECAGILVFYSNDHDTKTAYISLIGVLKKWQGRKFGKMLLQYCTTVSLQNGMEFLKLEVDLDNVEAIQFYLKNGFENCEKSNGLSVHMCKKIK